MERFKDLLKESEYKFVKHNSHIYVTGAPITGKSTISSLISSSIADCTWQNMDIIRLTAQMVEEQKPENKRNPFVYLGSCDAYTAVNDGGFSPESLIGGFINYSEVVSSSLKFILPKLETQGARDVLFDGVQLTPDIVKRHVNENSRLIVITSTEERLMSNARKIFADEKWLLERYSPKKLLLPQDELLRQAENFPKEKLLIADNSGEILDSVIKIIHFLYTSNLIVAK